MKKFFKTLGITLLTFVGVGVIGTGIIFGSLFIMDAKADNEPIEEPEEEVVEPETKTVETVTGNEIRDNESIEATIPELEIFDERDFMQTIHEMTHQKVYADHKWEFTPIIPQYIDEMLTILDNQDFENEDYYRETLNAWKNGDFSNAVEVHNTICNWQDGNIGKATRLLTPEEEEKFLKDHNLIIYDWWTEN